MILDLFKRCPQLKHMILYCCMGSCGALTDALIYTTLVQQLGWQYLKANAVSVCAGITVSFILNAFLNFKKTDHLLMRFLSFFTIGLVGLAISSVILYLLIQMAGVNEIYAKLISIVVVTLFQFLMNRSISFRHVQK